MVRAPAFGPVLAQTGETSLLAGHGWLGFLAAVASVGFLGFIVVGAWRSIRAYRSGRPVGFGTGPLRGIRPGDPPAVGWYEDPTGEAALRWWDGSAWTERTDERHDGSH